MSASMAIQMLGAALVLVAFVGASSGRLVTRSLRFQGINLAGGLLLLATAIQGGQVGFIALNAVWSVVAVWTIYQILQNPAAGQETAMEGA